MVSRVFSINTKCQIPVWRIEKIIICKGDIQHEESLLSGFANLPFERGETPFSKGFSVICLPIYQSTIDLSTENRYNKSIQAGGLLKYREPVAFAMAKVWVKLKKSEEQ